MNISVFPHHVFWSYQPNSDLPDELVAVQVLQYGDLDDMFLLSKLMPHEIIAAANEKIKQTKRWDKRTYFVDKILLGL